MREGFLFLIIARAVQFLIENQGSRKYVKGFISIITIVIIAQSLLNSHMQEMNMEAYIDNILNDDLIINNNDTARYFQNISRKEMMDEDVLEKKDSDVGVKVDSYVPHIVINPIVMDEKE